MATHILDSWTLSFHNCFSISDLLTNWDRRHDERVAVEQRRRLGANVSAEIVQQQLLLLGEPRRCGGGGGLLVGHGEFIRNSIEHQEMERN